MIFTIQNFVILFILILINAVYLITSKRKRKYGIGPSRIFQILFVFYWFYLIITLQFFTPNPEPVRHGKKIDHNKEIRIQESKKSSLNIHLKILSWSIKAAGIQAMLTFLLCVYGLASVNGRNEYFYRNIAIHFLAWGFCTYIDMSNLAI